MPDWLKNKGQELAGLVMEEETAFALVMDDETGFVTIDGIVTMGTVQEDDDINRQEDSFINMSALQSRNHNTPTATKILIAMITACPDSSLEIQKTAAVMGQIVKTKRTSIGIQMMKIIFQNSGRTIAMKSENWSSHSKCCG
jgi:hypothetical protein